MPEAPATAISIDLVAEQLRGCFRHVKCNDCMILTPFSSCATIALIANASSEPTRSLLFSLLSTKYDEETIKKYYKTCYNIIDETLKNTGLSQEGKFAEVLYSSVILEKSYSWSDDAIQEFRQFYNSPIHFASFDDEPQHILQDCSRADVNTASFETIFKDRVLSMVGQSICKLRPRWILPTVEKSFMTYENEWRWYHCLTTVSHFFNDDWSMINIKSEANFVTCYIKPNTTSVKDILKRLSTHQLAELLIKSNTKKVNLRIPLPALRYEYDHLNDKFCTHFGVESVKSPDTADFSHLCESQCVAFDGLFSMGGLLTQSPAWQQDIPHPETTDVPDLLQKGVKGYTDFRIDDSFIMINAMLPPAFAVLSVLSMESLKHTVAVGIRPDRLS